MAVPLGRAVHVAHDRVVALLLEHGQRAGHPHDRGRPGHVRDDERHSVGGAADQGRRGVVRPVAEPFDRVEHRPQRGLTYLVAPVEHARDRADPHPRVGGHVRDGDPAIASGAARGDRRTSGNVSTTCGVILLASRGRAVRLRAGPAGALAQPQPGRHYLAWLLIGSVVDLAQRPVHHPPGDLVDRDGHGGQPRVHQGGRGAAVEAGDGEVLADPQPEFRGHAVDHPGEPVTAGYDGVRPQPGPARGQQRPDLPARVAVVYQQHVRTGRRTSRRRPARP